MSKSLIAFHILCSIVIFAHTFESSAGEINPKSVDSLEAELKKNPDNISVRTKLAELYWRQENPDKVITTLDPYSAEVSNKDLELLADAYFKKNDSSNEARILNLILAKDPKNHIIHHRLGQVLHRQKKSNEAVEHYRTSISLKKSFEPSHWGLLEVFREQKDNYESLVIIKDMIKKFGKRPKYFSELCRIHVESAFLEEGISSCKEAIRVDKKNPDNHANLARCYKDKGETKTAENILRTASNQFKKAEIVQSLTGSFYFEQQNYGVANRYYSQAVLANRDSFDAQLGLARSSYHLRKFEQSLNSFENACRLNQKDTLRHFKEAATKLRLERNFEWEQKFISALARCN